MSEYKYPNFGEDHQVPAATWLSSKGLFGGVVHNPGTCTVCDGYRESPDMVQVLEDPPVAEPRHSKPLAEASGIRADLRDMGPLGVEIEEFRAEEARKAYARKPIDFANLKKAVAEGPTYTYAMPAGASAPNPKQRFGDLKVALQLVPPALAIHAAKALKEGADKYGAYNWRTQPVEAMTYIGGLLRHAAAYLDGEDIDPESSTGKTHLDGMAANIAILLDALDLGTLIDNRPPKGPAPKLVRTPK